MRQWMWKARASVDGVEHIVVYMATVGKKKLPSGISVTYMLGDQAKEGIMSFANLSMDATRSGGCKTAKLNIKWSTPTSRYL